VGLVAAAVATESLRIGDTEVERGFVVLAGITEVDADAVDIGGNVKRNFEIGFVLQTRDVAFEDKIGRN
jgi:hypothetical protein